MNDKFSLVLNKYREKHNNITSKAIKIESLNIDNANKTINLVLQKAFATTYFRQEDIDSLKVNLKNVLPDSLKKYDISIICNNLQIDEYVPNYYRDNRQFDKSRCSKPNKLTPLITQEDKVFQPSKGLAGKHLALWSSHGRYFEPKDNKWEWQRPRLYGIVEDTYTGSIVVPYLLPMLENAGAITLFPKERDIQTREIIVDNDKDTPSNFVINNTPKSIWEVDSSGFSFEDAVLYKKLNPFKEGTHNLIKSRKNGQASIEWIPNIPATGEYAVYISYQSFKESATDAHYTVYHSGGSTTFSVNQTMGGGTWIYLGKFKFRKGRNQQVGKVVLTNKSKENGKTISADAVKFGGGMGNIARSKNDTLPYTEAQTSGLPRFLEGARYWLQWAGYSDSIYDPNMGSNEYKDDYMSRGLWVNNLMGGSLKNPDKKGKSIPIDVVVALHSDAGISTNNSIIGSLAIHMTNNNGTFANGCKRIASRDLSDIIQTQTVNDINAIFDCDWTRRKLIDESYHEARTPEVPTLLFEFLSHQNYQDMKYGLDPYFRFIVARSIYKGILKYISNTEKEDFVVQPLPVHKFSAEFYGENKDKVFLSWQPTIDELEPTAKPKEYIVYKSINNNGYDNGTIVDKNQAIIEIGADTIYNFKVTAINEGGESFPSEVLSVAKSSKEKCTALLINGFERVEGPMSFSNNSHQGFLYNVDPGVPYKYDISFTGNQYDFDRKSEFKTNDEPGLGASYGNYEDLVIAGNTFNYPFIHGQALLHNKVSFVSCSAQSFASGNISTTPYLFLDLIYGKQKSSIRKDTSIFHVLDSKMVEALDKYLSSNGNLLITGEYLGSDVFARDECDTSTINFAEKKLHYSWDNATVINGNSISCNSSSCLKLGYKYHYFSEPNRYRYYLTAPDAIRPTNSGETVAKFSNTDLASTIAYNGKDYKTIISTIPLETIRTVKGRANFMRAAIDFFHDSSKQNSLKMVPIPVKKGSNNKSYTSTKKSYKQNFNNKRK